MQTMSKQIVIKNSTERWWLTKEQNITRAISKLLGLVDQNTGYLTWWKGYFVLFSIFPQTRKSMIIPKPFRVGKDSCLSVCLCSKQNIRMPVPHVLLFLTQHTSNCWYKWSGQVSSECQTIWCTTTKMSFFRTFVKRYMYKRMVKSESFLLSLNANFKLKRINFFHQIKQ